MVTTAIMVAGIVAGSIFYACKKNNISNNDIALKQELVTLNNDISSKMTVSKPSQKKNEENGITLADVGNAIGMGCAIAGADLASGVGSLAGSQWLALKAGLVTGGTGYAVVSCAGFAIGAIGGSYSTWQVFKPKHDNGGTVPPKKQGNGNGNGGNNGGGSGNGNNDNKGGKTKSIGEIHNEVLSELYEKFAWNGFENQYLINSVLSKCQEEFGYDLNEEEKETIKKIFTLDVWNSKIEQIKEISAEYAKDGCNLNNLLPRYNEKGLITGNIYEVLKSFFEVYSTVTSESSLNLVVSSYEDFVKETDLLSEKEKHILFGAFSVAYESPFFWMHFFYNEDIND
jgi:hypothetical protein